MCLNVPSYHTTTYRITTYRRIRLDGLVLCCDRLCLEFQNRNGLHPSKTAIVLNRSNYPIFLVLVLFFIFPVTGLFTNAPDQRMLSTPASLSRPRAAPQTSPISTVRRSCRPRQTSEFTSATPRLRLQPCFEHLCSNSRGLNARRSSLKIVREGSSGVRHP